MTTESPFSASDIEEIRRHGLAVADAEQQLRQLRSPPPFTRLDRPCVIGDGILAVPDSERAALIRIADAAASAGRLTKFVPASGAATRMFKTLVAIRNESPAPVLEALVTRAADGEAAAADAVRFVRSLDRFPFRDELAAAMASRGTSLEEALDAGRVGDVLAAFLDADGLGYGTRPKGQLLFHAYDGESRTPFEEHLVEATAYARDAKGRCRLHATVSPEHRDGFEQLVAGRGHALAERHGVSFDVDYSHQEASTDTIAVDLEGRPFRDANGRLVFRPGGHGALIRNLEALGGDLVLLKNIDNVVPDRAKPLLVEWKKIVTGLLVRTERAAYELMDRLDVDGGPDEEDVDAAVRFLTVTLSRPLDRARLGDSRATRETLLDALDRPLRVAGVVRNQGEPGGGPFWVAHPDGRRSIQIVETSQVDASDGGQAAILAGATHFNPVDLACSLRRRDGSPHALEPFVDAETVFVSRKSMHGRELRAIERPGLWNGAMAGWNTIFVEVPVETFAPVKTVFDLLRPEHQP